MNNFWCLDVPNFGLLRIANKTIKELANFRQLKQHQPESGGVLIGMHLNSGGKMVIDGFTPPQSTDKQDRCSHYRSETHSKLLVNIWENSEGHSTFVGLWHTHPEPSPTPSSQDFRDWKKALSESHYHGKWLFFVIIGQDNMKCWSGHRTRFSSKITLIGEFNFNEIME